MNRWLPTLAGVVAAAVVLALPVSAADQESPHNHPDRCLACHDEGPDGSVGEPRLDMATCRGCHPTADMHLVDVVPKDVKVHEGWPLLDGKLVCATCHAEPGCEAGRPNVPPYWRGGPTSRVQDFCYRCHDRATYQRVEPHHAKPDRPSGGCAACHTGGEEGALRVPADVLCAECHKAPFHSGVEAHMGEKPTLAAGVDLPLLDGRIACITCHDSHGDGDVPADTESLGTRLRDRAAATDWKAALPESPAWPGQPHPDHPRNLMLPVADGTLCRACHSSIP